MSTILTLNNVLNSFKYKVTSENDGIIILLFINRDYHCIVMPSNKLKLNI